MASIGYWLRLQSSHRRIATGQWICIVQVSGRRPGNYGSPLNDTIELSNNLRLCLIKEYRTEQRPDDGEFYSKIREYQGFQGLPNPYFEKRWWARLSAVSSTRANNLRQIILNSQHIDFREAFDLQLRIPGLSGGMRLSTTHKMFALKCHEVSPPE